MKQTVRDECLKRLTGKRLRRELRLFAACVFLLIKDHLEELEEITIDQEYSGHEQEVRWIILNMVRRDLPHCVEELRIRFAKTGRKSSAHELAWRALRREREPDGVITSREILSALFRLKKETGGFPVLRSRTYDYTLSRVHHSTQSSTIDYSHLKRFVKFFRTCAELWLQKHIKGPNQTQTWNLWLLTERSVFFGARKQSTGRNTSLQHQLHTEVMRGVKMRSSLCFALALLFLATSSVNVSALTWDFEKQEQLEHWKVINGKWEIEQGQLRGTLGPDYMGIVCVFEGSDDWTDYTLETRTTVEEGKYTYWMVRVQPDPLSYYTFERSHSNSATIWRRDEGQHARLMAGPALEAGHLETHLWKIEVKGDQVSVFLDDELLVEARDDTYKKGTVGFGGHSMDSATGRNVILLDDVSVNGPGIPESLSVSPSRKLALTWGEVKK